VSFARRPKKSPNKWAGFDVVELEAASAATGLSLDQLVTLPGVQRMTRTLDDSEEEALLIPAEILELASVSRSALASAFAEYEANRLADAEFRRMVRQTIDADKPA
jgi:hypothetical protein